MTPMYVTEPNAIDMTDVAEKLREANLEPFAGNPSFDGSHEQPFKILAIRSGTTVRNDIKEYFPQLQSIIRIGTGLDNVDLDFCKTNGIHIYNAAGANADAVSEYVIAVALYALRKLNLLTPEDAVSWNRFKFRGQSISEQSIGIVGFGNIGKLVYKKLSAFSPVKFLAYDPFVTQDMVKGFDVTMVALEEVLAGSTVVTLHLPLIPETEHLIDAQKLRLLPHDAILINASRGGIVDEKALLGYIEDHKLTYVADTVEDEPHPNSDLVANPNVIVTPHIASLTKASEDAMLTLAMQNFLDGKSVKL